MTMTPQGWVNQTPQQWASQWLLDYGADRVILDLPSLTALIADATAASEAEVERLSVELGCYREGIKSRDAELELLRGLLSALIRRNVFPINP